MQLLFPNWPIFLNSLYEHKESNIKNELTNRNKMRIILYKMYLNRDIKSQIWYLISVCKLSALEMISNKQKNNNQGQVSHDYAKL